MKTFAELMHDNASICTVNTNTHEGSSDMLTRWYNMWWGALTDTHMQLMDDGSYIIIGSRIGKNFLNSIMYARVLPTAPHTALPTTFDELLRHNHLMATMTAHNGQLAVAVGPISGDNSPEKPRTISIPPASSIVNNYYNPYDPGVCACCCTADVL